MLLLSYQLAIHKTIVAKKELVDNTAKKESISNLPEQLSILSRKEKALNLRLEVMDVGSSSAQNNLLKFLSKESSTHKVKIIDFSSPHIIESNQRIVETYMLQLEGGYLSILKLLNAIENKGSFGAINHLNFEKKKNYRTKRTYLQAQVFLEQVK